ncbi:helix-turn-helix transcriptional regulator [Sphingopyxis sp.]|uniref:helix-turn-helix transcriptional regulator n=1 Tax=Sphingopyxis sp. TaxID=1908224 RepID=UPI002FC65232
MKPPKSDIERAAAGEGALNALLRGRVSDQSAISDILAGNRSTLKVGAGNEAPDRTPAKPVARQAIRSQLHAVADLGALVRKARLQLGFTQQSFADLAGVGRRFVSELESGKPTLEADRVLRCCAAAGIDIFAELRAP